MPTAAARPLERVRSTADEELVEQVLAGHRSRFELLVRRHEPRVRRAVRRILRNRSEVDDVVQQAFVQAFTGLEGFTGTAAFASWLTRIAVNEALLHSRRARRRERAAAELSPAAEGPQGTPEHEAACRETIGRVELALPSLSVHQREVLQLVLEGLSHGEIARRLGIRQAAVKVRVHRARTALRVLVAGWARPPRGGQPRLSVAPHGARLIGSFRQGAPLLG